MKSDTIIDAPRDFCRRTFVSLSPQKEGLVTVGIICRFIMPYSNVRLLPCCQFRSRAITCQALHVQLSHSRQEIVSVHHNVVSVMSVKVYAFLVMHSCKSQFCYPSSCCALMDCCIVFTLYPLCIHTVKSMLVRLGCPPSCMHGYEQMSLLPAGRLHRSASRL